MQHELKNTQPWISPGPDKKGNIFHIYPKLNLVHLLFSSSYKALSHNQQRFCTAHEILDLLSRQPAYVSAASSSSCCEGAAKDLASLLTISALSTSTSGNENGTLSIATTLEGAA